MKTVVVKPEFAGLTEEQVIDAIDAYEAQVDEYYANKGDEEECGCGCSHDEGSCEDSDDDVIPSDDPIVLEVERLIAAYSDRFDELCKENGEVPEEALTYKLNFFFIKINIKTVSTLVEIDNIKVVYKHIRKDGTKESFGFHKTKVSKDS